MEITPADVQVVLSSADNLNAALKTLLKREGRPGNTVEPFVKSFRNVVARRREEDLRKYIADNYAGREPHFALLANYAFPVLRESVVEKVFNTYAEPFNATFERLDDGIRIIDAGKFQSIARDVVAMVKGELEKTTVPCNNFSMYALLATIFEPDVLVEVLKVVK